MSSFQESLMRVVRLAQEAITDPEAIPDPAAETSAVDLPVDAAAPKAGPPPTDRDTVVSRTVSTRLCGLLRL